MESDENSSEHFIENGSTNNNSIQLNCASTSDASAKPSTLDTSNYFELKICDTDSGDCTHKTNLNNNDLAIGFVDDDEETINNIENNATSLNNCNEAPKQQDNAVG